MLFCFRYDLRAAAGSVSPLLLSCRQNLVYTGGFQMIQNKRLIGMALAAFVLTVILLTTVLVMVLQPDGPGAAPPPETYAAGPASAYAIPFSDFTSMLAMVAALALVVFLIAKA